MSKETTTIKILTPIILILCLIIIISPLFHFCFTDCMDAFKYEVRLTWMDLNWIDILALIISFLILSAPFFFRKYMELSVVFHEAINLVITCFIPTTLLPSLGIYFCSDSAFFAIFFLAFGFGYTLLFVNKPKEYLLDKVLSIIGLFFFGGLISLLILLHYGLPEYMRH